MKRLLVAAALLATPALADTADRYDRALEQSVMKIVASRIGELRGGFDFAERPAMTSALTPPPDTPQGDWIDGLAPAKKRVIVPVDAMM